MPFCPKCGTEVGTAAICPSCGAAQGPKARVKRSVKQEKDLYNPKIGGLLCLLGWFTIGIIWIGAIIVWLTTEHEDSNKDVMNTMKWCCIFTPIVVGVFVVMMLIGLSIADSM